MKKGFVSLLSMGLGGVSGALRSGGCREKMRASVKCECELKRTTYGIIYADESLGKGEAGK